MSFKLALAALVAALIAKGDVAAAARMLAAYEEPKTPCELPPERNANVTDIASRRGR